MFPPPQRRLGHAIPNDWSRHQHGRASTTVESRAATAGAAAESGQKGRCPHVAGPFWVDSFAYYWYLLRSTRDFARQRVVRSPRSGPQIAWHRRTYPRIASQPFLSPLGGQGRGPPTPPFQVNDRHARVAFLEARTPCIGHTVCSVKAIGCTHSTVNTTRQGDVHLRRLEKA